jgi:hypothetical protein
MTKFQSKVPTLLQAKMAQKGKQMRVGAREGCCIPFGKTGFTG